MSTKNAPPIGVLELAKLTQIRCHFMLSELIKLSVYIAPLQNVSAAPASASAFSSGAGKPVAQYFHWGLILSRPRCTEYCLSGTPEISINFLKVICTFCFWTKSATLLACLGSLRLIGSLPLFFLRSNLKAVMPIL